MAAPALSVDGAPSTARIGPAWPWVGLAVAVVLVVAAGVVPPLTGLDVHAGTPPAPLDAYWHPRVGPGTVPSLVLAVIFAGWAPSFCAHARWRVLLPTSFVAAFAWMIALATVDGVSGLTSILRRGGEYLPTANAVTQVGYALRHYVLRIQYRNPNHWSTHVAGHPPGALLFFILLVSIGLGSKLAAALVVVVLAATTPVAVLATLRRLGAPGAARVAAPFVTVGPFAIWSAVSADAMFAAVAAWGMCLLAAAATARSPRAIAGFGVAAGLLLGYCCYLSYGLVLLAPIALAVVLAARRAAPLPWALLGVGAVVLTFTLLGFAWWSAYPVLNHRYFRGLAHLRPGIYWTWADLADLALCAGLIIGPATALAIRRLPDAVRTRGRELRAPCLLALAAILTMVLATVSQMSRAEVERIWLPFVPWALLAVVLLPPRWRRVGFPAQLVLALLVQSLLVTRW